MMKKIEKMVANYNKYATKHGYSTIKFDTNTKEIVGGYELKSENEGNIFNRLKTIYINGEIQYRFDKIQKEIKKVA